MISASASASLQSPRSIVLLGSTGSIGTQTLEVVAAHPDRLRVVGLAAHSNVELFCEQVIRWQPLVAALYDEKAAERANELLSNAKGAPRVLSGAVGLEEVATAAEAELLLGAMSGSAGLRPTMAAIHAGKDIAIANKETLVAAGELVMQAAKEAKVLLLPVDSEHSAIAQCLQGECSSTIEKLTLTASGGPFIDTPRAALEKAPAAAALRHPTWEMGRKITIDSATLMNKMLESIEAHWLFGVAMKEIEIVVHRQSIIHSFVTFCDRSIKAQLGAPDMRLPIQWALLFPDRVVGVASPLDLQTLSALTFERPDPVRFPALEIGLHAMEMGGVAPAMMNAANEVAVQAYLEGRTSFYGITDCVAHVLERCQTVVRPSLEAIFAADETARHLAQKYFAANPIDSSR